MIKLITILAASVFTFTSWAIGAEPIDSGPPAQLQKDQVPNSTSTGNYLEPQPDENGATQSSTDKKVVKKSTKKGAKATNIEKSKKVTESPDSGGMDVK